MTRPVFSDPALQAQFDRDGYVEVAMLSADEVAALRKSLAELRPSDRWAPDGSGPAMNSYHCSFLDSDVAYKRAAFDLLQATFAPVLARYLDNFRPLSANFYSKPPARGRIPVHQNWPVLEDLDATSVTVWCPLVDVDVSNGALHVVPGSQKLVPHVEGPRSPSFFAGFEEDLEDQLKPLPAAAGTGFIFDDSLVHGSPDNHSDSPRVAVQITCIPSEARPVFYYTASPKEFELVEADTDFYLRQSVMALAERQEDWTGVRMVKSRNRPLTKREFVDLLGRSRRKSASPGPGTSTGAFRKLLSWFGGRQAANRHP